jgi:hypothetical protein
MREAANGNPFRSGHWPARFAIAQNDYTLCFKKGDHDSYSSLPDARCSRKCGLATQKINLYQKAQAAGGSNDPTGSHRATGRSPTISVGMSVPISLERMMRLMPSQNPNASATREPSQLTPRTASSTHPWQGNERRQFVNSHSELSPAAQELAKAVDQYKFAHRRRFIGFEEILGIITELGYRKLSPESFHEPIVTASSPGVVEAVKRCQEAVAKTQRLRAEQPWPEAATCDLV